MLCQPIRRKHVWEERRTDLSISVARNVVNNGHGIAILAIQSITYGRFVGFIVRRQWAVNEPGGNEKPTLAVAFHDERRRAIVVRQADPVGLGRRVRSLGRREI